MTSSKASYHFQRSQACLHVKNHQGQIKTVCI